MQLDLGADQQQGGGPEHGVSRRAEQRRRGRSGGSDQSHHRRRAAHAGQRGLLRLWRFRCVPLQLVCPARPHTHTHVLFLLVLSRPPPFFSISPSSYVTMRRCFISSHAQIWISLQCHSCLELAVLRFDGNGTSYKSSRSLQQMCVCVRAVSIQDTT